MSVAVQTKGDGPNLALLHGWGLNGAIWQDITDELAETFTLYVVDLPGHGASSHVNATTLEAMSDAVARALPAKTHLLGWSLGGQVALKLAMHQATQINDIVLVATTPKFVTDGDWLHGVNPAVLADFASRLSTRYAATIQNFLALQAMSQDKQRMRNTIQLLQKAVLARGAPNIENLMHGLEILAESDLREQLHLVTQRTLVIQGDQDTLTAKPVAAWLAAALTNAHCAEYEMIAGAAHAPFLSHRRHFVDCVKNFLRT